MVAFRGVGADLLWANAFLPIVCDREKRRVGREDPLLIGQTVGSKQLATTS